MPHERCDDDDLEERKLEEITFRAVAWMMRGAACLLLVLVMWVRYF